jgi:hypothetical protein
MILLRLVTCVLIGALCHCSLIRPRALSFRALNVQSFPIEPSYTPDERAVPVLFATSPVEPPPTFLLPNLPPPGDQGKQASGAAWAAGYLAHSQSFRKQEPGFLCSPSFVYNAVNGGKDQGVPVMAALELLREKGCAPFSLMPYNERDFYRRPGGPALEAAQRYRIRGFARVDYADIEQLRAHLLQGSVVIVTMKVTESFVGLKDAEWVPAGDFVGIQSMGVVGYDITQDHVILQNSSGTGWAQGGLVRMNLGWFQRLTEKAFVIF